MAESNWYPPRFTGPNEATSFTTSDGEVLCSMSPWAGGAPRVITEPYMRQIGHGGATYNDFSRTEAQFIMFQYPIPIKPSGLLLSSWTEGTGIDTRQFGGLPTTFQFKASNDGINFDILYERTYENRLTTQFLVENKMSVVNDGLETPVKDYDLYSSKTDTTSEMIIDAYFQTISTDNYYTYYRIDIDVSQIATPDHRITYQYPSGSLIPYLPSNDMVRVSTFSVYAEPYVAPQIEYYSPTTEYQIIDFTMSLNSYGINVVQNTVDNSVNILTANINPDELDESGQYGLFQFISVPSLNKGYVRVSKTNTNISSLSHDDTFKLKINFIPSSNQKDLTYNTDSLVYKNNVFDDNFYYFEIQNNFSIETTPYISDITLSVKTTFNIFNTIYNILNLGNADYENNNVTHPNTNFAKTFGMVTDINNSLIEDPYPRDNIYPTDSSNIVVNQSLVLAEFTGTVGQIYPVKYSSIIIQQNQLIISLDKTSTKDLYHIYFLNGYLYIEQSISPVGSDTISAIVFIDDITGRVLVKDINVYSIEVKSFLTYDKYENYITTDEVLNLTNTIIDNPLPDGMPENLIYNKIVILDTTNQTIDINSFKIYENNINLISDSYIKSLYDASGVYYDNTISTHNKAIWGSDTLTQAQFEEIVVDTSNVTLTENGINYYNTSSNGSFKFYSHVHSNNINNLKKGTVKGVSAIFTSSPVSTTSPFFTIYTRPKDDGTDVNILYNSKYVITGSTENYSAITSGQLYTFDDILVSASNISSSAGFDDEILFVTIESLPSDTITWNICIRRVDLVYKYTGSNLTIEYGNNHNLAITQNAVISSTNNLGIYFYNNDSLVYNTTTTSGNISTIYNFKFNLIEENLYNDTIVYDTLIDESLPYYSSWTIENFVENNISGNSIMSVTVALTTLDTSANTSAGTFLANVAAAVTTADGFLYYDASASTLGSQFQFSSDKDMNSGPVDDEPVVYASAAKLLNDGASGHAQYAIDGASNLSALYSSVPSTSHTTKLVDYLSDAGVVGLGKTGEIFIQRLSEKVFGSKFAVDMFTNETAVVASYVTAVQACVEDVNTSFANSDADASGASQAVYDVMTSNSDYAKRFGLKYRASILNSATGSFSGCSVDISGGTAATQATLSVTIADGSVNQIVVDASGAGFSAGDTLTIKDADNNDIVSLPNINSVQAAMLNGTLGSPTDLPFEAEDRLLIKFTINSNSDQVNVAGDSVSSSVAITVVIRAV